MRKFTLNWGVVLAAVVLLGYTYISFLGMLYKVDGSILKAALFAIVVIAVVSACVYILVSAKVTKSKVAGLVGQIIFGLIILAAFLFSGGPFTSFLKVVGSKESIATEIDNVKNSALGLDEEYNNYASSRVDEYRRALTADDEMKIQSLQRRLTPDSIEVIQRHRQEWVASIGEMSIWNIKLRKNLKYMEQCVDNWTENYSKISEYVYENENATAFKYEKFNTSLNTLLNNIKNAGYSFWAILVAILSALVMMIPYWIAIPTPGPKGTKSGKKGKKVGVEDDFE